MSAFVLMIDPTTKEQLYEGIDLPFLELIIMEALVIILQGMYPDLWMNDLEDDSPNDDPEHRFMWSVDYLLHVIQGTNEQEGVDIPDEDVSFNSELHEDVMNRLSLAMENIQQANCPSQLVVLKDLFVEQALGKHFRFSASHLPDRVIFNIIAE